MSELYEYLLKRLRSVTIAQVTKVVANDEDLICFTDKTGLPVWDYEPVFERERARFTPSEWEATERSYSHYFGFATSERGHGLDQSVFFKMADFEESREIGLCQRQHDKQSPPAVGSWVIGSLQKVQGKGFRFSRWVSVSRFEVYIRTAMIKGVPVSAELIEDMEMSKDRVDNGLAHFARLVVNGDIEYYLDLKKSASSPVHFNEIDGTVMTHLYGFHPDLWQKYCERSLEARLYSTIIPAPAPRPIVENRSGMESESVGLNTPFVGIRFIS